MAEVEFKIRQQIPHFPLKEKLPAALQQPFTPLLSFRALSLYWRPLLLCRHPGTAEQKMEQARVPNNSGAAQLDVFASFYLFIFPPLFPFGEQFLG